MHAPLDLENVTGTLDQKLGPKAVAADHLDRQAADVPNFDLSTLKERAALAAQPTGVRNGFGRRAALGDAILDDIAPLGRRRWDRLGRGLRTPSTRPGHVRRV